MFVEFGFSIDCNVSKQHSWTEIRCRRKIENPIARRWIGKNFSVSHWTCLIFLWVPNTSLLFEFDSKKAREILFKSIISIRNIGYESDWTSYSRTRYNCSSLLLQKTEVLNTKYSYFCRMWILIPLIFSIAAKNF